MKLPGKKTEAQVVLDRYRVLFHSQRQIAKVLGVSERWVSMVATGHKDAPETPPKWMWLLVEFMERLPRRDWPAGVRDE